MSWLKLDDAMVGHRKTRRLLRSRRNGLGLAAFGLHALALLHCSQYLTDGFVEVEFVDETLDDATVRGKNRDEIVAVLVAGGQWTVTDGGFLIHDYLDHNPSREQVEAQRAKDAARKQAGRARQSGGSPQAVRADADWTDDGSHAESDGPVPSRPVPSQTVEPPTPLAGGEVPVKPRGKRQRELDAFTDQVAVYAAARFPGVDPQLVESAIGFVPPGSRTHEAVAARVHLWTDGKAAVA